MPVDTKRVNGPSVTQSLSSFRKILTDKPLLNKEGRRSDGREHREIRPIYLKAGTVKKANGSAYLETDGTKLICAVYGPRDNPKRHDFMSTGTLTCEFSYAPFAREERIIDHQERLSREYSEIIIESLSCAVCLESYPKAQIDVYVKVLEDNGNTLSHAMVAASVALADAGIEMLDLVTSCSAVYNDAVMLNDPSNFELTHRDILGKVAIAYLPSLNQISCLLKDGEQSTEESIKSVNACIESCLRVHSIMRECLTNS